MCTEVSFPSEEVFKQMLASSSVKFAKEVNFAVG
jgi:hypothetical protein